MLKKPDPIDVHVGSRVRLRRTLLGFSQEKLGGNLGLTFQQIQKYEKGANRIGSSRLYRISVFLRVPVEFFFEEMPHNIMNGTISHDDVGISADELSNRETLELVRGYYKITNPKVRKRVFEMVKAIGNAKVD